MMSKDKNYHQYIYDLNYDSSLGEPIFDKNRYLTLYSKKRNFQEDIELYGKVDNLFLKYETKTNVGTSTSLAYIRDFYFASSSETVDENGEKLFRHFMIFDDISYHSKFEMEAIRSHCLNNEDI